MIECLICGYTSHHGFDCGKDDGHTLKCPKCGNTERFSDDEYGGELDELDDDME